nr:hypothetical protein [Tanacetum cinerariifolium]
RNWNGYYTPPMASIKVNVHAWNVRINGLPTRWNISRRVLLEIFFGGFAFGGIVYGTVVDVFIPLKKSKVGKRFAFVRLVKVRYERPQKNHLNPSVIRKDPIRPFVSPTPIQYGYKTGFYVNAVNNSHSVPQGHVLSSAPALVLDDECLIDRDLS